MKGTGLATGPKICKKPNLTTCKAVNVSTVPRCFHDFFLNANKMNNEIYALLCYVQHSAYLELKATFAENPIWFKVLSVENTFLGHCTSRLLLKNPSRSAFFMSRRLDLDKVRTSES